MVQCRTFCPGLSVVIKTESENPYTWIEFMVGGKLGQNRSSGCCLLPDVSTDPISQHFHSSGALGTLLAWLIYHLFFYFFVMTKPKHNYDIMKLAFLF